MIALIVLSLAAGCSRGTDLEKVPVGSDVQLTRQDGGVVEGKLAARDETTVRIDVGRTTRTVSRKEIADVRVVEPNAKPVELPPIAKFREYTVPSGTKISVRLGEASGRRPVMSATRSRRRWPIQSRWMACRSCRPAAPCAAKSPRPSRRARSRAARVWRGLQNRDGLRDSYPLDAKFSMVAPSTKSRDTDTIALPAGGAIVGAIIGGGKGAAVGATVGGGAGTAAVLMTKGKDVGLSSGTELAVTTAAIEVKVPIAKSTN